MNKFRSFWLAFLIAVSACAYDCKNEVDYYAACFADGLITGIRLVDSTVKVTAQQQDRMVAIARRKAIAELLPQLEADGMLNEWIVIQRDPEIRKLNARALYVTNAEELGEIMQQTTEILKAKHPDFVRKADSNPFYEQFLNQLMRECLSVIQ